MIEKILDVLWPQDSGIISLVRILRLVRIFRITRLLQRTKALRELSKLVMMMTTCLKARWSSLKRLKDVRRLKILKAFCIF